jgi:hypothetical protein
MRENVLQLFAISAILIAAIPIPAQAIPPQQTEPRAMNPPKRLAYTMEIRTHRVQTLADGNSITTDTKEVRAFDSQGRSMSSQTNPASSEEGMQGDQFLFGNANDPVDGTQSNWDSRTKIARVVKMPPKDQRYGCWVSNSGNGTMSFGSRPPQVSAPPGSLMASRGGPATSVPAEPLIRTTRGMPSRPVIEDLGNTVIAGQEAHGFRRTITTPAGAMGNEKPLVRVIETWNAPGIITPLRQITTDPRTGTETREVVSLDLSEPPVTTFQPPEGYEIRIDEMHEIPCQR